MPKKFGINTKSAEAKEKKAEVKKEKIEKELKIKEDKAWEDDDKLLKAKEERKKESQEKKQKEKERKEENKKLAEHEADLYAKKVRQQTNNTKVSRAQIEAARLAAIANMQAQIKKDEEEKAKELLSKINEDINPNHILRNEKSNLEEKGAELVQGSGIDDAVNLLEEEKAFKHPEKKVKKAWNDYIDENLPKIKKEYPSLKRSQLLEILHKEFEKSEKNPFNKNYIEYNKSQS